MCISVSIKKQGPVASKDEVEKSEKQKRYCLAKCLFAASVSDRGQKEIFI
jgi:hypothetical protein